MEVLELGQLVQVLPTVGVHPPELYDECVTDLIGKYVRITEVDIDDMYGLEYEILDENNRTWWLCRKDLEAV